MGGPSYGRLRTINLLKSSACAPHTLPKTTLWETDSEMALHPQHATFITSQGVPPWDQKANSHPMATTHHIHTIANLPHSFTANLITASMQFPIAVERIEGVKIQRFLLSPNQAHLVCSPGREELRDALPKLSPTVSVMDVALHASPPSRSPSPWSARGPERDTGGRLALQHLLCQLRHGDRKTSARTQRKHKRARTQTKPL